MMRRAIPLLYVVDMRGEGRHQMFSRRDVVAAKENPHEYWLQASKRIHFDRPFDRVTPRPETLKDSVGQWYEGGMLNACYNAVDRHAIATPTKTAFFYDSPVTNTQRSISYGEMQQQVTAVADMLRNDFGVKQGDVVIIYMPNMPEAVFTMLACARIGAIHSVVFGGFSAKELSKRIFDSHAKIVVTVSCGIDGAKLLNYKKLVDESISLLSNPSQVEKCVVLIRPQLTSIDMKAGRDVSFETHLKPKLSLPSSRAECVSVPSSHPLYLLYTSGTTGVPKGIVRDTAGTCVVLATQMRKFIGVESDEVIFTASDIGWIVGTNFSVYGPLLNGCSSVLYEGKPVGTPDASSFYRIIEQYKVNALFTAPTALRAIKGSDPDGLFAKKFNTKSLHGVFLGGERTDPNTLHWAQNLLEVPVIDNWWQTETGSPISSSPTEGGVVQNRPGSCGIACPGWNLEVMETKEVQHGDEGSGISGELVIKLPLPPGALKEIWGRPTAIRDIYCKHEGYFSTFDAGEICPDGYVNVMARTDDIINVAGHRLSTGQMEAALCDVESVAEAAVVGVDCGLKGEVPLGLVVIKKGRTACINELEKLVRTIVGPIAVITVIQVDALPKTRSGKVLRRTIRQIAAKKSPIDVPATIEDPDIIPKLWEVINKSPMP